DQVALFVEPRAMRHVDLDPVRAMIELLARGLARLDRTVDQLRAFRHSDLRRVSLQVVAAGGGDGARGGEDARSGNASLVDGLLDADVAVSRTLGLDVADGGESLLQRAARRNGGPRRAIRERILQQLHVITTLGRVFTLQKNVRVRIDQAGHHGHAGEVDDVRAVRDSRGRADALDAIAADDEDLILFRRIGTAVDE